MIWQVLFLIVPVPILTYPTTKILKFPLWNETYVDRLRKNLLLKYDKFSRPTQHYNMTTLFLYLNIMHVEIDSKKSTMSVNTWVRMTWNDEKLKWNPEEYGGVDEISVGVHEIWQPDVYLYNSALHGVENYESRHCIVRQDGEVTWISPTVFHSYCSFNFLLWPFETNICELNIGSWNHAGDEIDLKFQDGGFDLEYYSAGEWKVQNITAHRHVQYYSCCSEPYLTLEYIIKLTRSSELYYHVFFIAPIPIIFLVLLTFWLRPQCEAKIILNISAIMIDMVFLIYFGFKVPARTDNMPLIVRFFSGCLYQMTFSIIISGIVIHISSNSYNVPIPRLVRTYLFGKLGKYLGLRSVIHEIEFQKLADLQDVCDAPATNLTTIDLSISSLENCDEQCIISQSKNVKRLEWILLATAIDRIAFLLFCFIFAINALTYVRINKDASL